MFFIMLRDLHETFFFFLGIVTVPVCVCVNASKKGRKATEEVWTSGVTVVEKRPASCLKSEIHSNQTMRLATVFNPRVSVHCTCLRVWICVSVARIRAVGEAESDTVKRFCVMQEVMLVYDCRSVCVCVV